jgi:O-antigen biosynthesis protein
VVSAREQRRVVASHSGLRVKLEKPLPSSLPSGRGTAIFLYGHCFHPTEKIVSLSLLFAGARHRPTAFRMPRKDLFEWLHGPHGDGADPTGNSYRSGFWATLPVPAQTPLGVLNIDAAVRVSSGVESLVRLGGIEITPARMPTARSLAPATIAVCMATYEPDAELLRVQIDSLRAQTDTRWICVISDGGSSRERYAQILDLVGDDPRFLVSRSGRRLSPYRNFERSLALAPPDAELLAPCDQDDRWYPEKLVVLRAALGTRQLVYCDQRLVRKDGAVLRESLWQGRRKENENLVSLLVANAVPGAAMLMRREVATLALPFPDAPGVQYHDHWLALVALAIGDIGYVDQPLYDYVQHPGAVSADVTERPGLESERSASTSSRKPRGVLRSRGWRSAYFGGYLGREVQAATLLVRCTARLTPSKRRGLQRFVSADSSVLPLAWLTLRPLRRLIGRDETMGGEFGLATGLVWRRLLRLAVFGLERPGGRAYDASFPDPPAFEQPRLRRWRAGR